MEMKKSIVILFSIGWILFGCTKEEPVGRAEVGTLDRPEYYSRTPARYYLVEPGSYKFSATKFLPESTVKRTPATKKMDESP